MVRTYLGIMIATALICGCAGSSYQGMSASVQLAPLSGQLSKGKVTFSSHPQGISKISGQISALAPDSIYQLLILGDANCDLWNNPHAPAASERSWLTAQKWPHLRSNAYGMAIVQWDVSQLPLGPESDSLIGKVLLIASAPSETNSPATSTPHYWACGVIQLM